MNEEPGQPLTIAIRRATREDAAQACQVLVRSIREICANDYGNDEAILEQWCANKTPETMAEWIANPVHAFLVAETPSLGIVGVGLLHLPAGAIGLCYVIPEVLHQGVGKRLLAAMEEQAGANGHSRVTLESSITGRSFYLRNGYQPNGDPTRHGQITAFPMVKYLAASPPSQKPE